MLRRCFTLIALALPACSPSLPAAAPTGPETAEAALRDDGRCPEPTGPARADVAHREVLSGPGSHEGIVLVRGGADASTRDDSGARDAELAKQNLESQDCVREAIAELSGNILDQETPWLVNTLLVELTWPQIEQLAHHPQVQAIPARHGGEPPP